MKMFLTVYKAGEDNYYALFQQGAIPPEKSDKTVFCIEEEWKPTGVFATLSEKGIQKAKTLGIKKVKNLFDSTLFR